MAVSKTSAGGFPTKPEEFVVSLIRRRRRSEADEPWRMQGAVVIDLARTTPAVVEELEPDVDLRTATDWGGFMDGTMELTDEGVVWVPSQHARRFGFDSFRLLPDEIVDIRVTPRVVGGEIDIDLTHHGRIAIKVDDPEQWQAGLEQALGG